MTAGTSRDTLVAEYNDVGELDEAFAAWGDKIAGVILEPVVGNMGVVLPTAEFVAALNRADKAARSTADLRRGDDRLSRGLWRRAVARWSSSPT